MGNRIRSFALEAGTRVGMGAVMAALAVGGFTAPASAAASSSAIVYTGGTYAGEAWFNRGAPAFFDVKDGKCDGEPVYVEWRVNGGSSRRYFNHDGCGTTRRAQLESGRFNISYRVCVDDIPPATCSGWKSDNNG